MRGAQRIERSQQGFEKVELAYCYDFFMCIWETTLEKISRGLAWQI